MPDLFSLIWPYVTLSLASGAAGVFLKTALDKYFGYRADRAVEELRSELRIAEARLSVALSRQLHEAAALRDSALSRLSARTAAFDQRRLEATERIWSAAVDHAPFKIVAQSMRAIDLDKIVRSDDRDFEKVKKFAETLWTTLQVEKIKPGDAERERPFVSPLVWAYFELYRKLIAFPIAQLAALRVGKEALDLLSTPKELIDVAKQTTPQFAAIIDDYGASAFPFLVEPLEGLLLNEIRSSLSGIEGEEIQRMKKAESIMEAVRAYDARAASPIGS